jgi:hypothetical protein
MSNAAGPKERSGSSPTSGLQDREAHLSRLPVVRSDLEDLDITDDEKVFHSFRHSIRRNLRGRAKEEMVDLICGRSDGKVGRRYGRGADMRPLREVVELIDYGGPDWSKVVEQARRMSGCKPESLLPLPTVQARISV